MCVEVTGENTQDSGRSYLWSVRRKTCVRDWKCSGEYKNVYDTCNQKVVTYVDSRSFPDLLPYPDYWQHT